MSQTDGSGAVKPVPALAPGGTRGTNGSVDVSKYIYFPEAGDNEQVYAKTYLAPPLDLSKNLSELAGAHGISEETVNAAEVCMEAGWDWEVHTGACCAIVHMDAPLDNCTVVILYQAALADGDLQAWATKLPSSVKMLDLSRLNIFGPLPTSFGAAANTLEGLNLYKSNYSGPLPAEWGTLPNVRYINLLKGSLEAIQLPDKWSDRPEGNASNLWSSLHELYVEVDKVKQPLPWGWLATNNVTLVPINGTASGSLYYGLNAVEESNYNEKGHVVRPLDLSFDFGVLSTMDRVDSLKQAAVACQDLVDGGLNEGACCVVSDATPKGTPPFLEGCSGVVLRYTPDAEGFSFQTWLNASLPVGVKGLWPPSLNGQRLPESFGKAGSTIQALSFEYGGFVGTLPAAWSQFQALKTINLDSNLLTGTLPAAWSALSRLVGVSLGNYRNDPGPPIVGNAFHGTLPSEWAALKNLESLTCWFGACRNISESIPETWGELCAVKELSFYDNTTDSQLKGRLPWKWMYEPSYKWEDGVVRSCFPDAVEIPGQVEFSKALCLTRGHPDLPSGNDSQKIYLHNDRRWALISRMVGEKPEQEAAFLKQNLNETLDAVKNVCTSPKRYTAIIAVYSVFGFFMLCALADLVLPHKKSCLACLVPEEGGQAAGKNPEAEQAHPAVAAAVAQAVPIVFTCSKALLILSDLVSDVIAVWIIADAKDYMWGFLIMLLAPNVLAAIVVHLRLSYLVTRQGKEGGGNVMPHKPAAFPLYQWLARKGGFGVLLLATVFMAPYWLLCEIPILFGAALGHISKRCSSKSWASSSWLHIGRFCSLLSLLMACTESPFSAVVFTFNYARGMSYNFPAMINDWGFVFTVGTALLHIVMEVWRIVPFIKQGKLRFRMKAMFLHLVITANSPQKQVSAVTSSVTSDIVPMSAPGAVAVYRSRSGSEPHMKIVVASADDDIGTSRQQQGDQNA